MGGGYAAFLGPDTVLVIDAPISADNGFCGSNNAQGWKNRGVRGIVTTPGCRDSDEIWKQRIPVYQRDSTRFINEGTIAVDRVQPWGGRARLGEARVGDLLGEMSLLDAGTRFSSCRTLTPCVVAVLEAHALDRMMKDDPRLAAVLLAALARRLSLRLRQASARLSALLTSST